MAVSGRVHAHDAAVSVVPALTRVQRVTRWQARVMRWQARVMRCQARIVSCKYRILS